MSGRRSRNKGAAAERELFKKLSEILGQEITRNLEQTRNGGAETVDLEHVSLEVKRHETLALRTWWGQTCEQAEIDEKAPVLAYRQSRRPWKFIVPINFIATQDDGI